MDQINQGKERIEKAIRLEKTDRTPIFLSGDFAFLHYIEPSATPADYVDNFPWALDRGLDALRQLKHIDAINLLGIAPGKALAAVFMAKTKLPGHELPREACWQVDEIAQMKVEDYDIILDKGWKSYQKFYIEHYLELTEDDLIAGGKYMGYTEEKLKEIGIVNMAQTMAPTIYDSLCAGRGIANFSRDMRRMPDKIKAVLDVMTEELMTDLRRDLAALQQRFPGESLRVGVTPAVRGNCDFLSRDKFEKFVWPLYQAEARVILEMGGSPYFHMDANWTAVLDYFKEFPAKRCIFDSDGMTDIHKVKEILGDRMCMTGIAGASLMALGTPDEVYKETKKEIAELGPTGFIMSGSCTLPHNTKPENIDALIAACVE